MRKNLLRKTFVLIIFAISVVWLLYEGHEKTVSGAYNDYASQTQEVQSQWKTEADILEQNISDGYKVYVDGVRITDTDSINIRSTSYTHTIDDQKKIVYFEKKEK